MRLILAAALIAATPVAAEEIPRGCFHRLYTDKHLANHPAQIVRELTLAVYDAPESDDIWADMVAVLADQGRMTGSHNVGKPLDQVLNCWSKGARHQCAVDCDGGSFRFTRITPDSITIETSYLTIGPAEECGGSENMVEVLGEPVRYRLSRVDAKHCEAPELND